MTTHGFWRIGLAVAAVLGWHASVSAQMLADVAAVSNSTVSAARAPSVTIMLVASGSTVIETDFPIKRFALTNPAIADATVVDPHQLLVDGKSAGNVSLIVWGEADMAHYELNVYPPIPTLQRQLQAVFPRERIGVGIADEAIVLSGSVSSHDVSARAAEIAEKSSEKSTVVNLLQIPGARTGQQVMLQVKVAEVSQRALTELGSSFFTGITGYKDWIGRSTTQQFSAPDFDQKTEGGLLFSDYLNLFLFNTKENVGTVINALKERGFFQSLAEPTLIAYNGQEASFLAGGEVPIPVAQGITGAVTVSYKEFGVRLTFRPTIAGDVIRLKVRPEVSSLDFANGVTLEGFRIPALTTRRAETDVELRDGQSFAIGGLLNNLSQNDTARIPGLGDIPILGYLFRSKAERKERTELVVIITPRLVEPLNAAPPIPAMPHEFLPPATPEVRQNEGRPAITDTAAAANGSKVCLAVWCW